tara:strand:+ start:2815 stop:2979 length:165 start_codon:yes stop_codon:yes gene_type:complete
VGSEVSGSDSKGAMPGLAMTEAPISHGQTTRQSSKMAHYCRMGEVWIAQRVEVL